MSKVDYIRELLDEVKDQLKENPEYRPKAELFVIGEYRNLEVEKEKLERQLEEAREQEITFLNSLLWDMLPSDPTYKVVNERIEKLKEKDQ